MTSTTPPPFLGAFVDHKRCVTMHRAHHGLGVFKLVHGMSLLSYTVALAGIRRQGSPGPFSDLST